jgi:RNA polymerase sigma-70 factor (ECF subfamily)
MYRVALNTAISDFRRKKRTLPVSDAEVALLDVKSEPTEVNKEEQFNMLYAAISHLPEIDKAIVMLYLEDKGYEEMEDILGITSNNLRVKMNRIREKLRHLTKNISHGT